MKYFLYITLVSLLVLNSCKKQDSLADLITGKWQLTSSYNGLSSGGSYQQVNNNLYIRFNTDGSLSGNAFPGYSSYSVSASAITFSGTAGSVTYGYSFPENTLQLNQVGCTGGCGQRFTKVP